MDDKPDMVVQIGTTVTRHTKPKKPYPDFPLFPHASGHWCKKIRGKSHYFGRWDRGDHRGEAALALYLDQRDDLYAGRTPRTSRGGLTLGDLANRFLTHKEQQRDSGEIRRATFSDYFANCRMLIEAFGKSRLVDDLTSEDFQELRARFANRFGVYRVANEVQKTRTLFKFGFDSGLIDKPIRYGPSFVAPRAALVRAHRQRNGLRMFERDELLRIIGAASQPLKSMILLGANCGFGNHDCGSLPFSAVDLDRGWINYPRPKTAIPRRCPLWPETTAAIREAIAIRPKPAAEYRQLVFLTTTGRTWSDSARSVSKEFRALLEELKLYRRGLGFYALRHTFQTIADATLDQVAVSHIMGHATDRTMAGHYRERVDDARLVAVSDFVRAWLFADDKSRV